MAQSIKQEVTTESVAQKKLGAKFLKINDFDPTWRPSPEETAQNQAWLAESKDLAEKTGLNWPLNISSVEAIREDRREL